MKNWRPGAVLLIITALAGCISPTPTTHTVSFNTNGGSAVPDQQVIEGNHAVEPIPPTKSNWMFVDWYSDSGLTDVWDFDTGTVNSVMTLYARWEVIKRTVSFNTNGGSAVQEQEVAEGGHAVEPTPPMRSGHAFMDWHSDSGLSDAWDFASGVVNGDMTLYARWVIAHTVTFDSNSGSTVQKQEVAEGGHAAEPTPPTKGGYAFMGWYSNSGLTNAWDFGSDTVDGDMTLYAKWEVIRYTVSFNTNGGNGVSNQGVADGGHAVEPSPPTRSGYAFDGWYSDSGLTNAWNFDSDMVNSDMTLYARWVIARTVTFISNGGSAVQEQKVAEGDHAAEPPPPTRSGYVFGGWYTDSGLSNAWTFGSDTVNSDITLYARWAIATILVQGGTFQMGSTDSDAYSDESPVHSVTVDSFYMAETEVTFDQYDAYCTAVGISKPDDEGWGRGSRPVINVSWYDAVKYSNWLSEKEGLSKAYSISGTSVSWNQSAKGYRLPTEAEWEYAARGGGQSQGYKYAGSNDVSEVGWYDGNSSKTQPVKGKKANELGLYDMSGNVYEWCWDWYDSDYYSSSPGANPTGSSSGSDRVLRGGSWLSSSRLLRVALRNLDSPGHSGYNAGFRLVRPAD